MESFSSMPGFQSKMMMTARKSRDRQKHKMVSIKWSSCQLHFQKGNPIYGPVSVGTYYSSILQYMSNKFVPKHCPVQALLPISFDTHRPHEISKSLKSKIFPFRFKIYQTNPILHQNETFRLPNPHHR